MTYKPKFIASNHKCAKIPPHCQLLRKNYGSDNQIKEKIFIQSNVGQ